MKNSKVILGVEQSKIIIERLACQLVENHQQFNDSVVVGLQPRGILLAKKIRDILINKYNIKNLKFGLLDITFFRDDLRQKDNLFVNETKIDFLVENKKTILIDDILFTGRSVRAALSALQSYGRPKKLELLVLIDRRFSREYPIQPDYTGIKIDSSYDEKVILDWTDNNPKVIIFEN